MAMIASLAMFFLAIVAQAIDPNNYIWFEFKTETYVQPYSDSYRAISLPCKARIGECAFSFTLLPPGWIGLDDKLLIPTEDAYKFGNYAVQLTAYELTGESLDFSLVLEMSSGKVITYDRGEFFGQNGFDTAPPQGSLIISNNNIGGLASFPSLETVRRTIQGGDVYDITTLISNIINKEGNCTAKANYLNEVLRIVQNQMAAIDGQIRVAATEIDTRVSQIKILEEQQAALRVQINTD